MDESVVAVASSMEALGNQYAMISHNLANSSTVGYKRFLNAFAAAGAAAAGTGEKAGGESGAKIVGTSPIDFSQGNLVQTGRPLDLALAGKGFFVVETPEGPLYMRNGTFQVNAQGQVVDAAGRTISGQGGPIVLPNGTGASAVRVTSEGKVLANGTSVGQFQIVEFEDTSVLKPAGLCAFRAPPNAKSDAAKKTTVQQGYQEGSNVSTVDELVGLITVSRLYEANLKNVRGRDERMKNVIQVLLG